MFDCNLKNRVENGLFVKNGNADNIVIFWDEYESAASYILDMYRLEEKLCTNDSGGNSFNGFIKDGVISEKPHVFNYKEYNPELARRRPHYSYRDCYEDKTVEYIEKVLPSDVAIKDNKFIRQIEKEIVYAKTIDPMYASYNKKIEHKGNLKDVAENYKSISIVKPLCSFILDRSTFFKSVDGLPNGYYLVVLNIEGRDGEIIKKTYPYYFEISKR